MANIEQEFLALMPQTLEHRRLIGRDLHGEPIFGESNFYRCRVVEAQDSFREPDARRSQARRTFAWVFGVHNISEQDFIKLPDGREPVITLVSEFPDETGPHHEKIEFA